jgi:alkanesulfonate monooxygenase SsuD/methylene tetrahydromethanopterin reductase-like flavin-dependent oxidoreductase (luciferase family)
VVRHSRPPMISTASYDMTLSSTSQHTLRSQRLQAQWAENHGFVWFSVLDHMIQIPRAGEPNEPFMEGWTVLAALVAVTMRIRLATLCTAVGYRNPAHLAKIAASVDVISRGRLTAIRLGVSATARDAHPADGRSRPNNPKDVGREASDVPISVS